MSGAESWTRLYIPRTPEGKPSGEGHKIFRSNVDGQIAIADWSGQYPDQTDDGILYVSLTRPVVLSLSCISDAVLGDLPVWSLRQQRIMVTLITLDTLRVLRQHIPELKVELDAKLMGIMQQLLQYVKVAAVSEVAADVG